MSLDQYLGLFIDESKENLQLLNDNLLKLEKNTEDTEILNDIFRVAHTFKGMAKTMGFNATSDLTHHMENLLEPLRSGKKKATSEVIDLLFCCLDSLDSLVESIVDSGVEGEDDSVEGLVKRLQTVFDVSEESADESQSVKPIVFNQYEIVVVKEAIETGLVPKEITVFISNEAALPGVRSYMVNSELEDFGEIFKYNPSVEDIEAGSFLQIKKHDFVFKAYLLTSSSDEEIKEKILNISEIDSVEIVNFTAEQLEEEKFKYPEAASTSKTQTEESEKEEATAAVSKKELSKVVNQTIRVSAGRLDSLMNLVGELVINKTRIFQLAKELNDSELSGATSLMENITGEIQEIVMQLRMVQIEQVFNRFPRLVRDISKNLNKNVSLVLKGKDIEIDRAVIDEIGDPLVHLIRNSLDHGLETPEERINAGKPAKGTLELSAFNEGDNIVIKVRDDGKGICAQTIKNKAIEKGLVKEEEVKSATNAELLDLIFKPGLSTMKETTDLSGRGVGMDVVKSKVSSLGGNVGITSEEGKGTTISIVLPSTMSIIQSLLVKSGEETYALPLNYINEVIDVPYSQVKKIQNKEVITVRDHTIPLIKLNEMLDVPNFKEDKSVPLTVIIVKSNEKYAGLAVSELIGQQEVVIKPINKNLSKESSISGATTLGNGEVALILNINTLIS